MSRAWMPLYVGDYLRDTRDLSTLQHGAYLLLIMHYWQHDSLPADDRQLALIAGLAPAIWRRIGAPIKAKFRDGWKHKRIEAEMAKADRAVMQRRRAGYSGGLKSGVARAIAQGEAIIAAQARATRALALKRSGSEASGQAKTKRPPTNHNQRIESSSDSPSVETLPPQQEAHAHPEGDKPASQWSRQELDALFARRKAPPTAGEGDARAATPAAPSHGSSPEETGG